MTTLLGCSAYRINRPLFKYLEDSSLDSSAGAGNPVRKTSSTEVLGGLVIMCNVFGFGFFLNGRSEQMRLSVSEFTSIAYLQTGIFCQQNLGIVAICHLQFKRL